MQLNEIDDVVGAHLKRWWHSLTIWVGKALTVGGLVLEELSQHRADIQDALGQYGGAVITAIGVTMILLRLRTKSAVALRKPKA